MRWILFFAALVFVSLFVVTTFSHSTLAREEAAAYFPPDVIDQGLQFSFERGFFFGRWRHCAWDSSPCS